LKNELIIKNFEGYVVYLVSGCKMGYANDENYLLLFSDRSSLDKFLDALERAEKKCCVIPRWLPGGRVNEILHTIKFSGIKVIKGDTSDKYKVKSIPLPANLMN